MNFVHTNGGTITIADNTVQGTTEGNSVIVRNGAVLDVSGEYTISTSGTVTGGNAGTLTLEGATLSVGGDLRGFSVAGHYGGDDHPPCRRGGRCSPGRRPAG